MKKKKVFKFRPGYNWKVDPEVAGKTLEKIAAKNKTREVTPDMVVEEAKHPDNPLHNCFDWNNDVAGMKWRKHTARQLLGSIVVSIKFSEPQEVRAFVNVKIEEHGQVYCSTSAMSDDEKMKIIVGQATSKLVAASRLLKTYKKLQETAEKIDGLVAGLDG